VTAPAAVVLAAGAGSRFGARAGAKLRAEVRGRPVLSWAVAAALDAAAAGAVGEVIVVVGDDRFADLLPAAVRPVGCPRWRDGQAHSLQAGLAAAAAAGAPAAVVGLGDAPLVPGEAWARVARAQGAPVAVAAFGDRRGPPVRLDRSVWSLLPTGGDEGARVLWQARSDLVVTVDCPGDPLDVDTVADLAAAGGA
jgi:CTP:molybdopterin cytidylyltransferase MocA